MAIREIAASFEHICDGCKKVETTATKHRPNHWIDFNILRDAYDFQGHAAADGSTRLTLCYGCGDIVIKMVNKAIDERRAAMTPASQGE